MCRPPVDRGGRPVMENDRLKVVPSSEIEAEPDTEEHSEVVHNGYALKVDTFALAMFN
jgi:hypothetical protein